MVAPILTLNGSNDVFPPKEVPFGGQDDGWRHLGKIFPKNSPKGAWIGSFKPKRQNLYIAISPELLIRLIEVGIQTTKGTSWVFRHYPDLKRWLFELTLAWHWPHSPAALHFVFYFNNSVKCPCNVIDDSVTLIFTFLIIIILKINMTSYFSGWCSDLDEIRQSDAEWHADYGKMVEIETGSRIPIWRMFVFRNRK